MDDVVEPDPRDPGPRPTPERTSELLAQLSEAGDGRISVGEIVTLLRSRAFGLLLFVFAVPCMLPSPPPIPLICATVMMLVAVNMIGGHSVVWLPERVSKRSIDRGALARLIARVNPIARKVEAVCRPRWLWLTDRGGKRVVGPVIILLGVILLIPLPVVGNFTPGLAVAVMGLGIAERDGIVLALGLLTSLVAVIVSALLGWLSFEVLLVSWTWASDLLF